jgi:predicted NACHT family NTPase
MYNKKSIEDVLKYLYENKQDDLAKVIVEMIAQNATARQCAVALGKPPNPGHVTTYIPAIVRYWIDNDTITFNTKDF